MKSIAISAANVLMPALLLSLFAGFGLSCMRARGEAGITFKLDQPQRVSLAVYHPDGRKARDLLAAEQWEAGKHTVAFDGLDDTGDALAAGQYTWRLIHHSGLKAEYITSLGTSWRHMHWPAQHGGPVSVGYQAGRVWVSGTPEGAPQTVCVAADGSDYVWAGNTFFGWGHPVDTAVAGDQLWVLMAHMITHETSIWRQNGTTGKQPSAEEDAFYITRPVRTIGDADAAALGLGPAEAAWTDATGYGWLSSEAAGGNLPADFRIKLPQGL